MIGTNYQSIYKNEVDKVNERINDLDRSTGRNYGIDAFRIVSMIMIVILHIYSHGGVSSALNDHVLENSIAFLPNAFALCAVNCYGLISGYVGVCSNYRFSNIVSLWLQVAFYSVSINALFKLIYPNDYSGRDILFALFPVINSQYWYFTSYFLLFLFVPVLNYAINNMGKKQMGVILVIIILFVSVFAQFYNIILGGDVFNLHSGYSTWWLMILYLIGGYIKKFDLFLDVKKHKLFIIFCVSSFVTWGCKIFSQLNENNHYTEIKLVGRLVNYTSISVVVSAVSLLLLFSKLEINKPLEKIIARLSPLSFGVYLIHDNILVRNFFIKDSFVYFCNYNVFIILLLVLGYALLIYSICSLIDYVRYMAFYVLKIKKRLSALEEKAKEKLYKRL